MKMQVREQLICCIFAVILFLSGVCVDIPHADAPFSYKKEVSITDSNSSVIRDGSKPAKLEQVCIINTLRRDTATYLSSNKGRNLEKRFLRNVAGLIAASMLLSYFFLSYGMTDMVSLKLVGSHTTIVRYIQQTDGKK